MSASTTEYRAARKATRRSPNWAGDHPQPLRSRRTPSRPTPDIIRFPGTPPSAARPDAVAQRLHGVQSGWTEREREQRRLQAIAKQEALLALLADAALEDDMRLAVADGEQPILPPEIEILRN